MVHEDRWRYWLAIAWIGGLTLIFSLQNFLPRFLRPDLYQGDLALHVWWTYRFADPELFPNDPIAAFMSWMFAPYGYQALYRTLVPLVDAQVVAESLSFILAIPVVILAFLLGRRAAGGALCGGVVASTYFIVGNFLRELEAGLPRSFALMVLMLGIWALMTRRQRCLGLALLLGALFYPPSVLNLGLLAVVVVGFRIVRERKFPPGWPGLVVLGLVAAVILAVLYVPSPPPSIGAKVTIAEARAMPEFWSGGRSFFFEDDPLAFYFHNHRAGMGIGPLPFVLVVILLIASAVIFRGIVSFEAWALAGTSLASFVMAHLTLFTLHLPNNYTTYTLPLFSMLWLGAVVPKVIAASTHWPTGAHLWQLLTRPVILLTLGSLLLLGLGVEARRIISHKLRRPLPPGQEEVYAFLATLPKETLVAAHPRDANHIPLRARRSVLASAETALPFYKGYYRFMAERSEAELIACYASDMAEVDMLYDRYGADVFLVNRKQYNEEGSHYYAPFEEANRQRFVRGEREGFVLLDPPADRILFHQGDFTVIRLGPPRNPYYARNSLRR